MHTDTLILTIIVMLAVTVTLLHDVYAMRRRTAVRRTRAAEAPAAAVAAPAVVDPASVPAETAPSVTLLLDPPHEAADPLRVLAERLAALRLLGLEHVRTAHPLFTSPATAEDAVQALAMASADTAGPSAAARGRRRRRPGATLAASHLRLVVDSGRRVALQ